MLRKQSRIVLATLFALAGLALSGYLSWYNLWGPGCGKTPVPVDGAIFTCSGGGQPVKIFGQPTCIYGFFMFLTVLVLLLFLARGFRPGLRRALLILATVGMLFAASLSVYEIWIAKIAVSGLPACVYGFFLYVGIFLSIWGTKPTAPGTNQPPVVSAP